MDKVLFVGVGHVGSSFVEKVNDELAKINAENGPQVNSVCFLPTVSGNEKVPTYGLNEMDAEQGNSYTSRRSAKEYREVSEKLSKEIRAILQQYLDRTKE